MRVVIDANLIAALVLPLPYSAQAKDRIDRWKLDGTELLAPTLFEYEIAAILRKAIAAKWLTTPLAIEAMHQILMLGICCIPPTATLHEQALIWAERLGQSKTYDAHYLALAEQEGCILWTADRRLVHSAHQLNAYWVRDINETDG